MYDTEVFNFNDINLDFLNLTPPKKEVKHAGDTTTELATTKKAAKCGQLAQRIAQVDNLIGRLKQAEEGRSLLQQTLQDFQKSANEIQSLYKEEKFKHAELLVQHTQLQKNYEIIDTQYEHVKMQHEQLQGQLDDAKSCPFEYNDLVMRFLKIAQKLKDKQALHWHEQTTVEQLNKYCQEKNLRLPAVRRSPQRREKRSPIKHEKAQPELPQDDTVNTNETVQETTVMRETRSQGVQASVSTHTQGTQHISTTTTRGTSTSCFIKQHNVGTNFPEPTISPPLNDMLIEILKWNDVSPISPIVDPPNQETTTVALTTTTGTCTDLCNVQRQIDFIPQMIKRSLSRPPSRLLMFDGGLKREVPTRSTTPTNINNFLQLSTLTTLQPGAFEELWQVFGQMLLGLLQNRSTAITTNTSANTPSNSSGDISNQQEFSNWLYSVFEHMQKQQQQENYRNQEEQPPSRNEIPLIESAATTASNTDTILRPQARKQSPVDHILDQSSIEAHTIKRPQQHNIGTSPIQFIAAQTSVRNDFDSTASSEPQVASAFQPAQKSLKHEKSKRNKSNKGNKNNKMVQEILKLLPEVKSTKAKRREIKKLLQRNFKEKKQRKKQLTTAHKTIPVKEICEETAVDFLAKLIHSNDYKSTTEMFTPNIAAARKESASLDVTESIEEYCEESQHVEAANEKQEDKTIISMKTSHDLFGSDSETELEENLEVVKSETCVNDKGAAIKTADIEDINILSNSKVDQQNEEETQQSQVSEEDIEKIMSQVISLEKEEEKEKEEFEVLHKIESNYSPAEYFDNETELEMANAAAVEVKETNTQSNSKSEEEILKFRMQTDEGDVEDLDLSQDSVDFMEILSQIRQEKQEEVTDFLHKSKKSTDDRQTKCFDNEVQAISDEYEFIIEDLITSVAVQNESIEGVTKKNLPLQAADNENFENINRLKQEEHKLVNKIETVDFLSDIESEITTDEEFDNVGNPVFFDEEEQIKYITNKAATQLKYGEKMEFAKNQQIDSEILEKVDCLEKKVEYIDSDFDAHVADESADDNLVLVDEEEETRKKTTTQSLQLTTKVEPKLELLQETISSEGQAECFDNSSPKKTVEEEVAELSEGNLIIADDEEEEQTMNTSKNTPTKLVDSPMSKISPHSGSATKEKITPSKNIFTSPLIDAKLLDGCLTDSTKLLINEVSNDTTIFEQNMIRRYGRKRKVVAPTTTTPPPPMACKRSERLREKRENSKVITTPPSTPHLIQLGKYTNKINRQESPLFSMRKNKSKKLSMDSEHVDESRVEAQNIVDNETLETNLGFFRERCLPEPNSATSTTNRNCDNINNAQEEEEQEGLEQEHADILPKIANAENAKVVPQVNGTANLSEELLHQHFHNFAQQHRKVLKRHASSEQLSVTAVQPNDNTNTMKHPTTHLRQSNVKPESTAPTFSCTKLEIYSSPASPTPTTADNNACTESCEPIKEIPLELNAAYYPRKQYSLIRNLIRCYSAEDYTVIRDMYSNKELKKRQILSKQLQDAIKKYLHYTVQLQHELAAADLVQYLQEITADMELILKALIEEIKLVIPANHNANRDLYFNVDITPAEYREHLQGQSISYVVRQFQSLQQSFVSQLLNMLEDVLFNYMNADKLTLEAAVNLTQLYLICILNQDGVGGVQMPANPARLFIAKCLYYHLAKSVPMIYEVLCCFPTVLPHREERSYDHSDALITVIQHVLMCTKYDMDKSDLRTKELLSKLRFQYHYEPFKPNHDEVLTNLLEKLKANKLEHIKYAFAIICKRLHPARVTTEILQSHLLPLANEYYIQLQQTSAYDERIAAVLECISIIIKPFPIETDVSLYLSLLSRFLNAVPRSIIQEAAVQAILRLQRFGYANCYSALQTFKPQHNLQPHTKAMLKTFIHRKSLKFWQNI